MCSSSFSNPLCPQAVLRGSMDSPLRWASCTWPLQRPPTQPNHPSPLLSTRFRPPMALTMPSKPLGVGPSLMHQCQVHPFFRYTHGTTALHDENVSHSPPYVVFPSSPSLRPFPSLPPYVLFPPSLPTSYSLPPSLHSLSTSYSLSLPPYVPFPPPLHPIPSLSVRPIPSLSFIY